MMDRRTKSINLMQPVLPDKVVFAVGRSMDATQSAADACRELSPDLKHALIASKSQWSKREFNGGGLVKCAYHLPAMFKGVTLDRTAAEAESENDKMLTEFKSTFDKNESNPFAAFNEVAGAYCFANDNNAAGKCTQFYNTPVKEGEQVNKCIRMGRDSVAGNWCQSWFAGLDSEAPGKREALAKEFCNREENLYASECACMNADKIDPEYNAIMREQASKKDAPAVCWYWPCTQPDNKVFLTQADRETKNNCPDVCKNVLEGAERAGVSGNIINQEVACAQGQGDGDERWKVYLLGVSAVAVFLFILVIVFAVKNK